MKTCSNCRLSKDDNQFYKDRQKKNGLTSCCKSCFKLYSDSHKIERANYAQQYRHRNRKTLIGYIRCLFGTIKQRCNNPNRNQYKDYGGRGIKVLFESSDEFVDYIVDVLKIDPRGLEIDRVNNNGNYEKGNIRFVTPQENCNNRRR